MRRKTKRNHQRRIQMTIPRDEGDVYMNLKRACLISNNQRTKILAQKRMPIFDFHLIQLFTA